MKSLVVGLGFGQLYVNILKRMGHEVVTVDINPDAKADFTELTTAIQAHTPFDTAHICVPNHLHYKTALKVADHTKIVFVEKPGVETINHWRLLTNLNKSTRFMMTKNNQWRNNIKQIAENCEASDLIQINWVNSNRIPGPGTWFTNKSKAFGGVSRDLLPHLMSIMISANKNTFHDFKTQKYRLEQRWVKLGEETTYKNRARYMLSVKLPISKNEESPLFISLYDEIFLNISDSPFDQNRLFAALGYQISKQMNFQVGYLRHRSGGLDLNRLQLAVFLNTGN